MILELLSSNGSFIEIEFLDHGSHRSIENMDALADQVV
jgi:hypothetical protein